MPTEQNNRAEVGYKKRFCNDRAHKKSKHHYVNKNDNNSNIFISSNHILLSSESEYDYTHIFMLEPGENFNFSQCSLAVCLMFKWRYFLDCYFGLCYIVISRSEKKCTN